MQRLTIQRDGKNKIGTFELAMWVLAGCVFVAALAGLFRHFNGQDGLFTFITGGILSIILLVVNVQYRKRIIRIQTFMESLPLEMWMSDKEGRYILQSGESYRLMGNVVGRMPDDLGLPSETLVEWKSSAQRVLNGETVYKESSRVVDGKARDIFTIINPVKNGKDFIGSVGVTLNITERKKIEKQLRSSAEQLTMLNNIARAITTLGDVDSVLNLIRVQVQHILPVDTFMVLLYQPETNMVSFPLVYDNGRNWHEPDHELTPDMRSHEILKTGKSLLLNLTEEELENITQNKNRSLIGDRTLTYRSFIYVPLIGQDGPIGVLSAMGYNFNTYTQKHLELLESFALQATIAIENARLYQAQQKEIAERKQAEQEILKLNTELEERVEQRTLQLQEANLNLNSEKALLEKHNRQRELMTDMTDMLQSSLNIQEASKVVSTYLKMLFPQKDGALYLLNEPDSYESASVWGAHSSLDTFYTANDCWALRRGKPYHFGTDLLTPPCLHFGGNIPYHSFCIPLLAQGESLGNLIISTDNDQDQDLMGAEERKFMEAAAGSISIALANLRLRERLQYQSIRDVLTGLYNRRYFDETLLREMNRASRGNHPLSILMFDIDHFKKFNDAHGHDAGDFVLNNVSEIMLSFIRESDIACRYGGEEFMIILPDTPIEIAQKRAETLRGEISRNELRFNDEPLGAITISIGVAAYPQHGEQKNALIKSADEALYQAKQNGRNRVVVSM
jgi:diguanylate cyclase (GGDEF)-like protein/PAS domain S-box-containing protein